MYTHTQYEARIADVSLAAAADVGNYSAGYVPHIIRAAAVVVKADVADAAVVKIDRRPAAGSDTGRGDGDIAVVNVPAGAVQGDVVYVDELNAEIKPGEEAVVEVTDAGGAGATLADVVLLVEPRWELPGNNLAMSASL